MSKKIIIPAISLVIVLGIAYTSIRMKCNSKTTYTPASESDSSFGGSKKVSEYYTYTRYLNKEEAIPILKSDSDHPEWTDEDYEGYYDVLISGRYPSIDGNIKEVRNFKTRQEAIGYCVSSKI